MSMEQMRCCLTKTIQMRCFILVMITNEMFEVTNEMFSGWPATCEMLTHANGTNEMFLPGDDNK